MNANRLARVFVLVALGTAVAIGCRSYDADTAGEAEHLGSVNVALTGVSNNGVTYRLRNGTFSVSGPQTATLSTETNIDAPSIDASLQTGNYTISLQTGWYLEKNSGGDAGYTQVDATLTSPNPVSFSIQDQATTTVKFTFTAGGQVVQLGSGTLSVTVGVNDCPSGQSLCSNTCVSLSTDSNNCGACGTVCSGGTTCTGGACACPAGSAVCSGSCVNLQTSSTNCGACGNVCPAGTTCTNGTCGGTTCAAGTVMCGTTCTNLMIDPKNCGSCGLTCTVGSGCSNGTCTPFLCNAPDMMCGGTCVDPQNDPTNCGGCGIVCFGGQQCVFGVCQ